MPNSSGAGSSHPIFVLKASSVARVHSCLAALAFVSALVVGCLCHYKQIVKNGIAGYPQEWFPSVSATIGDWYPERNIFQILIALTSGPRFGLIAIQYYYHRSKTSSLPLYVFISGIIRTLTCGGWVYITSSDDHDVHDIFMVSYIICNIPWMIGGIVCTPIHCIDVLRIRFFLSLIPLVYFFIQHKVYRIPGAYTYYAFFEWGLISLDVCFDSVAEKEFSDAQLQITLGSALQKTATADEMYQRLYRLAAALSKNTLEKSQAPKMPSKTLAAVASQPLFNWRTCMGFISNVYLSYVFWSILTALIPTLFYYSVWELGIAGQELALLSTLSPILLSIGPLAIWFKSKLGLATLHLLSFSGLMAYALDSPFHRLLVVSFATSAAVLRQVIEWSGIGDNDVSYQGILTGVGFVLSSLSKHAYYSNNPIWPFTDAKAFIFNRIGFSLAFLALLEFCWRKPAHNKGGNMAHIPPKEWSSTWSASIALGSLLFTLHNLLADSSTLIAWSWTGYRNGAPNGPVPHLHGSLTHVAQILGLLLSLSVSPVTQRLLTNPVWFFYGVGSSFVMYKYRNWTGYMGGLNFTIFAMSIIPSVLKTSASTGRQVITYFMALLVYCLFHVAGVFTVAYAFVPGGEYFRERTDLMIIVQVMCLASTFQWSGFGNSSSYYRLPAWARAYSQALLSVIAIFSFLVTLYRWPPNPTPYRQASRIINAGIWTVHFGINNIGRDSQQGIKTLLEDMQLDIVGLLETDLHRPSFGHRDLTRVAVEGLGYNVDIGPGPNSHTWGAVLLSKFPIINSTHHLLPSPHGELAPAIEAVLDVYGREVVVVVSHNGQEETPLDRELQSRELARIMAAAFPKPVIFLGYVVTKPHAERPAPYKFLVEEGLVHDIDQDDLDRWCEYILYRGLYRTAYARVSRGIITDTEMQIGQFMLPKYGSNMSNDGEQARYLRVSQNEMPTEHWFHPQYYGSQHEGGKNGHFYHVFNTPLYYQVPENVL
ncbi:hypothetical protein AMATHDRAFT_153788 [Amanita thiersii Skay4041]|uniref:Calcofluor white hypersensitive protein n=1 Tax=Amanita thiersii Skay4041 TaxID=703135 RepID=A0A2A9N829_9AGAR|nr:hypothetical protein AMATHDRAFT_153788 [Amanita thiersii Skay4041]